MASKVKVEAKDNISASNVNVKQEEKISLLQMKELEFKLAHERTMNQVLSDKIEQLTALVNDLTSKASLNKSKLSTTKSKLKATEDEKVKLLVENATLVHLKQDYGKMEAKVVEMESKLSQANNNNVELNKRVCELSGKVKTADEDYKKLDQENYDLVEKNDGLKEENRELKNVVEELRDKVKNGSASVISGTASSGGSSNGDMGTKHKGEGEITDKIKELDDGSVNEVLKELEGSTDKFITLLNYKFDVNGIRSGNARLEHLIYRVLFKKEEWKNIYNALEKYKKGLDGDDASWKEICDVIKDSDDVIKRGNKAKELIEMARRKLRDDGTGYEEYIQTFMDCEIYWKHQTMNWRVEQLMIGLSPRVSRKFKELAAEVVVSGKIQETVNDHWFSELRRIVDTVRICQGYERDHLDKSGEKRINSRESDNGTRFNRDKQSRGSEGYSKSDTQRHARCFECNGEGHKRENCPNLSTGKSQ